LSRAQHLYWYPGYVAHIVHIPKNIVTFAWHIYAPDSRRIHAGCASHPRIRRKMLRSAARGACNKGCYFWTPLVVAQLPTSRDCPSDRTSIGQSLQHNYNVVLLTCIHV
jgi:hypothetical protein